MVGIVGDPDRLHGVFGHFLEQFPLRKVGQFAKQGGDFSRLERGAQFGGMGQIGGVDVPFPVVLEKDSVAIKTGFGISTLEVTGQAGEMLGGKGRESEGAVDVGAPRLDRMPVNGEADELGKEEAFFQPVLHIRQNSGWPKNMQRRAARAQPERLDELGNLAGVIAVHVADPENFRNVGFDLLEEEMTCGGGAAIEQKAAFLSLDKNAGMFATGTCVAIGGA